MRGGECCEVSSSSPALWSPAFVSQRASSSIVRSSASDRVPDVRCIKPFTSIHGAFGCGQCLPCRVQRRRTWTHRILLEALDHGDRTSFVTLTYGEDVRELNPKDLQDWLKRFRKAVSPGRIRYFACGEYGDTTWRPHFHAALFGWPSCSGGVRGGTGGCGCHACSVVRETWKHGHVMVGQLSMASAQYIAGYVTKKMTHRSDIRLGGRHPEFARMSLRPGIGALAMHNVASDMMQWKLEERGDVPTALRYGSRLMPLGRYLRMKLRKYVGHEEVTPESTLQEAANRLQLLRAFAFQNDRSVASVFEEINSPYAAALNAKISIRGKHETL